MSNRRDEGSNARTARLWSDLDAARQRRDLATARARAETLAGGGDVRAERVLADVCARLGDMPAAAAALARAEARAPTAPGAATLGAWLTAAGDFAAAIVACRKAIALDPTVAEYHYNLANACFAANLDEEALSAAAEAVRRKPQLAVARNTLGAVHRRAGRLAEAISQFQAATVSDPGLYEAQLNLGIALTDADRTAAALPALERARALRPELAAPHGELALTLSVGRRWPEAFAAFGEALRRAPDDARWWQALGDACAAIAERGAAIEAYSRALERAPDRHLARLGLARELIQARRADEAQPLLEILQREAPDLPPLPSLVFRARAALCDWRDRSALAAALVARVDEVPSAVDVLTVLAASDDPDLARRAARSRVRTLAGLPRPRPLHRQPAKPQTIAYVSGDFGDHPVGWSIVELLERHDRARVRVLGVALAADDGGTTARRIRAACDEFIEAADLAEPTLAAALRERGVDVAVDLAGHTTGARPGLWAARIAPVQLAYLGYPGTLAAAWMDYVIADARVLPAALGAHFDESAVRLPHSFFPTDTQERAADGLAVDRASEGLPDDALVLAAFVQAGRYTPEVFAVWLDWLRATPRAVLWLQGGPRVLERLQALAGDLAGDLAGRLVMARRVPTRAEHLARHRLADLFVDVFPYNAHSTARDALWRGLPVLSAVGRGFHSRVGASLLHAAGLGMLACDGLDDYRRRGLELLADDGAGLAALRGAHGDLRGRPLFDTARLAAELEWTYGELVARAARGERPSDLDVPAGGIA